MSGHTENEELTVLFNSAASYLKHVAGRLDSKHLLYFYARFKQVKEGSCNIPKPRYFDFEGKHKWEAWKKLGTMSRKQAMLEYVDLLSHLDPDWESKMESDDDSDETVGVGVSVSTMYYPDDPLSDEKKTVFDWCKECHIEKVRNLLASQSVNVNDKDAEGMALLHWAADRGFVDMVELLLHHKADPNIQDVDDQTAIHYAVCCGHTEVVKKLLEHKASLKIADSDGILPTELDASAEIKQILDKALGT